MSSTIPTHYVIGFNSGIRLLQQQMASRFRGAVSVDTAPQIEGKRAAYDQIDATVMVAITDRHGPTQVTDDTHARRWVTFTPAEKASLIDRADMRRILNNPVNDYTRSHKSAADRFLDDKIIGAFFATATTGEEAGSTAAFDTAYSIASGSVGMRVSKIQDARRLLEAAENEEDDDMNRWYAALNAQQRDDLYSETEVINDSYATTKALAVGAIDTYMGFTFLKSQRLGTVSSERACPFWVKSSMKAAVTQEPRTFMDILPERRHSVQVRTEIDCGATRMDEKGVVRAYCTE